VIAVALAAKRNEAVVGKSNFSVRRNCKIGENKGEAGAFSFQY